VRRGVLDRWVRDATVKRQKDNPHMSSTPALALRFRRLVQDTTGHTVWETIREPHSLVVEQTALVLCDVWDHHWCRGAEERLAMLLPRINLVAERLRAAGVLIVHAPSSTMAFYAGTPARERARAAPRITPPDPLPHDDPPLPLYHDDGGSDTPPDWAHDVWSRQHAAIDIDQTRDMISDSGDELYSVYRWRGIKTVVIMGVHTNMCILDRPFAIKALVRWGFDVMLVRDLTDAQYNPAMPPYVSHAEGTELVINYIEGFWCPTVTSEELVAALAPYH
jgi:nicotinamidase-related amidase